MTWPTTETKSLTLTILRSALRPKLILRNPAFGN